MKQEKMDGLLSGLDDSEAIALIAYWVIATAQEDSVKRHIHTSSSVLSNAIATMLIKNGFHRG